MSEKEIAEFKVPKSKIDFISNIPKDPNYEIQIQEQDKNCRFVGKICRFRVMINEALFE